MPLTLCLATLQMVHEPRRWNEEERCKERPQKTVQPDQSRVEADEAKRNPEESERSVDFNPQMSLQHRLTTV